MRPPRKLIFSATHPYAFTGHGTIMVATILNTPVAIETSVAIVRAFVKLREILLLSKDLVKRLDTLESKYDQQFKIVFDAIRKLMQMPVENKEHG